MSPFMVTVSPKAPQRVSAVMADQCSCSNSRRLKARSLIHLRMIMNPNGVRWLPIKASEPCAAPESSAVLSAAPESDLSPAWNAIRPVVKGHKDEISADWLWPRTDRPAYSLAWLFPPWEMRREQSVRSNQLLAPYLWFRLSAGFLRRRGRPVLVATTQSHLLGV